MGACACSLAAEVIGPMRLKLRQPEMLFQNAYTWLVFMASMDVMMTYLVLWHGGVEVNGIADAVLLAWGFPGIIAFKFALVTLVICICEAVGRRRPPAGLALARFSVAVNCIPVIFAAVQLVFFNS
jgi:hypothetical protein